MRRLILCPKYPGLPPWGLGCEATRESSGWGLGPSPSAAPGRLFSITDGSLYLLCPHRQHRLPGSMSSHLVVASLASPPTVSLFHLPVHSPHFIQRGLWYKRPLPRLKHLWPSAPHPDWPLSISLTITALLILVLAICLVTVSPQDWSPILRLSIGIAYVVSCVLLLGCYFLRTA